jgi:hypothetical protein
VLVVRIGHADGRRRQLARLAAAIGGLDVLDAALDLADVVEVVAEPGAVDRADLPLETVDRGDDRGRARCCLRGGGGRARPASRRRRTAPSKMARDRGASAAARSATPS